MDDLEAYAENTYGSLHYLALESLGIQSTPLDHIGSHIGKATGIVSILRGIPYNVRHPSTPSVVLPLDVMAAHDVSQESVLRLGPEAPGLKDAVFEVATRANDHMLTARKMLNEVGEEGKGPAFSTFLPAVPTSMWLETLEKCDFNVFDSKMMGKQWTLPWRAWRAARARSF